MTVGVDVDRLRPTAHAAFRRMAKEGDAASDLGAEASSQQVADYYTHDHATVVAMISRLAVGLGADQLGPAFQLGMVSVNAEAAG